MMSPSVSQIVHSRQAFQDNTRRGKLVIWILVGLVLYSAQSILKGDQEVHHPVPRTSSSTTKSRDKGFNLALVIGNGRTGTNWLGSVLLSHHDIMGKNERKPEFQLVRDLAVNISSLSENEFDTGLRKIVNLYQRRSKQTQQRGKLYHSDKSHPAIFFSPELHEALPGARFLGINRCVYPTVASCMRHSGVRGWFEKEDLISGPNKFLGVTAENVDRFQDLPVHVHCALRWAFHQLEYERVIPLLNSSLLMLDYRAMSLQPKKHFKRIQEFLELERPFNSAPIGHPFEPLSWKSKLTHKETLEIDEELARMNLTRLVSSYCHESEIGP